MTENSNKWTSTKEIKFYDVDAEMFRRELIDYVKELLEESKKHKSYALEMKKKLIQEDNHDDLNNRELEIWSINNQADIKIHKIRLIDIILQRLGFRLTDFISIDTNLEEVLK